MTHAQTDTGTPVLELDASEYEDFLEQEVMARLGMSAADFRQRYGAGELDDADHDVGVLAGLLLLGQNGDRTAAWSRSALRRQAR